MRPGEEDNGEDISLCIMTAWCVSKEERVIANERALHVLQGNTKTPLTYILLETLSSLLKIANLEL